MTAYIVFIKEREHDADAIKTYAKAAGASLKGRPGKPLSYYGRVESFEGPPLQGAVIMEFPSFDEAKAWYMSEAYQEARRHRFAGADYRVFITEGM